MSQIKQLNSAVINASSSGDNTIIAAVTGRAINIWQLSYTTAGAVSITYKAGSTALSGAYVYSGNGSDFRPYTGAPWFYIPPNTAFVINLSGAVGIAGTVQYELV